jgi:hypothetical protein
MDADWMDMDTKLAVLNSNNVLEVIAVLATKSHVANNYADIISLPNTIPEGSNYYFISQESGGSNYAESGPHNIPKSFSPYGGNLPSVTAATVLETYSLDTPIPLAVAQTSAPSSSTTGSVTPTPTVSDASSSDTKSSSASATPKSSENSSQNKSSTESEENPGQKILSLSKTVIIVIAVVIPVVAIAIISTAICVSLNLV